MAFQFPWTNFHELNLDWFLSKFKQFANNYLGTTATVELIPSTEQPEVTVTGGTLDDDTDIVDPFTFNFKLPVSQSSGAVDSVNGQTGTVVLDNSDIGLGNVDNVRQYSPSNPPPYPVTSVNGQTGDVTVTPATDAQVSNAVDAWLDDNVTQETGYVLDRTLSMSNAAAPADLVGDAITQSADRLASLDGFLYLDPNNFRIGNIAINNSGWIYNDMNSRVSTKQGVTYHLKVGDVIALSDYTDARYYIGWKRADNTYGLAGWLTSDYIVAEEGDYVINISNRTEVAQTSIDALFSLLSIYCPDNTNNKLQKLSEGLSKVTNVNLISSNVGRRLFPVSIPAGSTLTMSTYNGDTINKNNVYIYFFNANKQLKGSYNFWQNISSRTITLSQDWGDIAYVALKNPSYITIQLEVGGTKTVFATPMYSNEFLTEEDKNNRKLWNKHIMSVAHRGTEVYAPENTMPAFEMAFNDGFEFIETDVRRTSDGKYVLIHDDTVDRTTDGTGSVANMTLAEIEALDAGSWFSSYYAGTKVPTLEQFLSFCRIKGITPVIEIKVDTYTSDIVDIVKSYGFIGDKVIYIVTGVTLAQTIINKDPNTTIMLISTYITDAINTAKTIQQIAKKVILSVYLPNITAEFISDCMDENITLGVWTVDYNTDINTINPYVTQITSGAYHPGKALQVPNI